MMFPTYQVTVFFDQKNPKTGYACTIMNCLDANILLRKKKARSRDHLLMVDVINPKTT